MCSPAHVVEPFSMPTSGRGSRLPLVGRRLLSYRFLCQVKFQLWRVILREHGIKREKGSLKMPCQVQIGFDVWQDCDTFDVCWVLTNFLGFLGVECWDAEDQRVFCFVAWAAPDVFWTRRMRLLQQNIVEISDFEIPCFGSVLRVLVVIPSFYPSLWYIFSTSPFPMEQKAHQPWHQNQWIVSELEWFLSPLGSKNTVYISFTRFFYVFLCFSWAAALAVRSFPPILIHIIFSRSHWYQRRTNHGINPKRPKIKQSDVSFTIFFGQKSTLLNQNSFLQKAPFSPWKSSFFGACF